MYSVYRLENIVTKKNYIGMTSLKPQIRWCKGYEGKMKEEIHSISDYSLYFQIYPPTDLSFPLQQEQMCP